MFLNRGNGFFLVSLAETAGEHQLPTTEGQQKKIRLECSLEVLHTLFTWTEVGLWGPQNLRGGTTSEIQWTEFGILKPKIHSWI